MPLLIGQLAARSLPARGLVAAASLCLALALPGVSRGETVLMRTGSRIDCSRAVNEGRRTKLELAGGGVLHVATADIKRIDSGSSGSSQRPATRMASLGAGSPVQAQSVIAQSSGMSFDPVVASRDTAATADAVTARQRAVDAGKASAFPTVVGAMSGVEPMPVAPQLRTPPDAPQMDARRRAYAERSRISPGSASALLSRVSPGSMSAGSGKPSTDGMTGRDAPRVMR